MQYKLVSLRKMGETILRGSSSVNNCTVASALALALEEVEHYQHNSFVS